MDVTVVSQPCKCEVTQVGSNSCAEHKSLCIIGTFTENLLQLILELTFSEKLVSLVEYNSLHTRKPEICFSKKLHKTSRCSHQDIRINRKTLELSLISMPTQNECVAEVNLMQIGFKHTSDLVSQIAGRNKD